MGLPWEQFFEYDGEIGTLLSLLGWVYLHLGFRKQSDIGLKSHYRPQKIWVMTE